MNTKIKCIPYEHNYDQKFENRKYTYWIAPETYMYFKCIFKFGRGTLNFVG